MIVKIYGCSDDLIEVIGGDIEAEFNAYKTPVFILFSDGARVEATYTASGEWKLRLVEYGETFRGQTHYSCSYPYPALEVSYSDLLILEGEYEWVGVVTEMARAKR